MTGLVGGPDPTALDPLRVDEVAARGAVAVGVADPHAVPVGDRVAQQRQRHDGVHRLDARAGSGLVLDATLVGRGLGCPQPVDERLGVGPVDRRDHRAGAATA